MTGLPVPSQTQTGSEGFSWGSATFAPENRPSSTLLRRARTVAPAAQHVHHRVTVLGAGLHHDVAIADLGIKFVDGKVGISISSEDAQTGVT